MQYGTESKYWNDLTRKCESCLFFSETKGGSLSYRTNQLEKEGACDNPISGGVGTMGLITAGDICDEHTWIVKPKDPVKPE